MFSEDSNLERKKDPLLWWKERQKIYPWIATLAKKYLSIIATYFPCERIFSKAGQIVTARRNRLKAKVVEHILFLHCNTNIYKKSSHSSYLILLFVLYFFLYC